MAKIGGFDPNIGIAPFMDGHREVGRTNLPVSLRVIPESMAREAERTLVYGKLSDSALMERFAAYLAPDIRHRELLSPDVFFEALEEAAEAFEQSAGEQPDGEGQPGEGPLAQAARALRELLADRGLCEKLRNLILRA
jgi:hypothetical protein